MKEQITELKDRCRRNNLRFMGMKKKSGVESETWEESKAKVKVFQGAEIMGGSNLHKRGLQ